MAFVITALKSQKCLNRGSWYK